MKIIQVSYTLFFLVLTTFGISSCDNQSETELLQEKLIGDWTSLDSCKNYYSHTCSNQLLLSFEKDDFRTKNTSEKHLIILHNRHLYFKSAYNNERPNWRSYRIIFVGKRFLKIKGEGKYTKEYLSAILNRPYKGETITLRKCRKRNAIQPNKIVFYSSACYGRCPNYFLEVKEDRTFRYFGENYVKKGFYTGNVNKKNYNELIKRIQQIPYKRARNSYSHYIADAQLFYVTIHYDNKHVSYKSNFSQYSPPELKFIIMSLMNIGEDTSGFVKCNKPFDPTDFDFVDYHIRPLKEEKLPF